MSRIVLHVPRIGQEHFVFLKDSRTYTANMSGLEKAGFQTSRLYSNDEQEGFCLKTFIGHEIPMQVRTDSIVARRSKNTTEWEPIPEMGFGTSLPFTVLIVDDRQKKKSA